MWELFEFYLHHQHEHVLRASDRLIAVTPAAPLDLLMLFDDSMGTIDLPGLPASRIEYTQYVATSYLFTPVTAVVLFCGGVSGASPAAFSILLSLHLVRRAWAVAHLLEAWVRSHPRCPW